MTRAELDVCLAAIAGGDEQALAAVYTAFYRPVFLLAVSLTNDTPLAEDVAQEVFLTVRACAGRYRQGSNARAWLFGITKNTARYFLRGAHRENAGEDALETVPAPGGMEDGCLGGLLVAEALRVLSAGEYPVMTLHVFGGLALTEIARYLDIPYGTVVWRYSEAKKKIKRFYQHVDEQERRDVHES